MRKHKECLKCGVERKLQITAKIHDGSSTYSLKRLCWSCLLKVCNLLKTGTMEVDYSMIMDSYCRDERFNELQREP